MNDMTFTTFLLMQLCLAVGYVIGRTGFYRHGAQQDKNSVPFQKNSDVSAKLKSVKINESTYVTNVSSESLVKKGNELGMTSTVDDNISEAANKLAQLKRGK